MYKEKVRRRFEGKAQDIARQHTALTWRDFYGWFEQHGLKFYSERKADPDGSSQRYEERLRTLDKLLRRKLDQLIDIFGQQCELEPGNPIYPLIGYLEGTRLAEKGGRSERMPRLIEALRPDEKPHVPDYYLIVRIAIVGSCDDDPSNKEGPDRLVY